MLGSEIWEEEFVALLSLVKELIVDVWAVRNKIKLIIYGVDSCLGIQTSVSVLGWRSEAVTGVRGSGLVSWVSFLTNVIRVNYVRALTVTS